MAFYINIRKLYRKLRMMLLEQDKNGHTAVAFCLRLNTSYYSYKLVLTLLFFSENESSDRLWQPIYHRVGTVLTKASAFSS